MTRPAVSVVMPFAGTVDAAREAVASLLSLTRAQGDELIVADNSGSVRPAPGVTVVSAHGERSPARARNAGATRASNAWILFLDADCAPVPGLLDAYFEAPVDTSVGALAGGIVPAPGESTLAARYATARNFLSPEAHLAHPFRPRAAAANLLVRRAAFEDVGGFYEGLRAAEDTDFCWRIQDAGWRLEIRPAARVEHRYRTTVAELRRQWRGYAAGRAWLARRYEAFTPEPGLVRAVRRRVRGGWRGGGGAGGSGGVAGGAGALGAPPARSRGPRAFLALDTVLALDELAGFALSNRPTGRPAPRAELVLVADRYPVSGLPAPPAGARVEAARRPPVIGRRGAPVTYREDDGVLERALAFAELAARHPLRCAADLLTRSRPNAVALAPAALRLARDPGARVQTVGGGPEADAIARRLADLAGAEPAPPPDA